MQNEPFVNEKLELAERLVCGTDSHIFLTGKAGTGKTTFLRRLHDKCYKRMVVVAPTGVAAINAEGTTIHSFFQLPFGPHLPNDSRRDILATQKLTRTKIKIIRSLDLLVIDEISMVRADILDAVDEVLRRVRRSSKPFGGVQLLMIGDIHQLAPVAKPEEWDLLAPYYDSVYFFSSHALSATEYICIELDHIYRQSDPHFISLLNKVRNHCLDRESLLQLNSRYKRDFNPDDSEGYITLTTHNYQADKINEDKLNALKSKSLFFDAVVKGIFPENNYPTKRTLELKIGARVMFVKNDSSPEKRYYNGKIGTITDYDEDFKDLIIDCDGEIIHVGTEDWKNYEYSINSNTNEIEEKEIGCFSQVPLRLAWAVTIHKSQGLTFNKVIIDAGQAFAHGQVYVALSRCTTLEGIVLKTAIPQEALISDYAVNHFDDSMPQREADNQKLQSLQHNFQYSLMEELYSFDSIEHDLFRLLKVISDNYTLFEKDVEQEIISLRHSVTDRMCHVANKFAKQIKSLHDSKLVDCAENEPLQQRLRQANIYFLDEVKKTKETLSGINLDIDNKTVKKQLKEILKELNDNLFIKQKTLEACADKFTIEIYQKNKAFNTVEAEKTMDDGPRIPKNTLMAKLMSWRAACADAEDMPEASIVPVKALAEIARQKPLTIAELARIPKLGKKRVGLYGVEILKIVAQETDSDLPPDIEKQAAKLVTNTYEQTRQLVEEGLSIEEIATERHLTELTIANHISRFIEQGLYTADRFVDAEAYKKVSDFISQHKNNPISDIKLGLGSDFSYGVIRIVHAQMKYDGLL